jgi:DNA-binding response OmpR family regulator
MGYGDMNDYLLAEDDSDIQNLVRIGLRINGLSAHIVNDGHEALDAASQHSFSLIMLDRHMPGMDGMVAAAQIRTTQLNADTPILFLSGDSFETTDIENCYLLQKPFTVGELIKRIRSLT